MKCDNCGKTLGPRRKRFCSNRCKDKYHNKTNPRGRFAHLANDGRTQKEKDFDDIYYMDYGHPFESGPDGHGQW